MPKKDKDELVETIIATVSNEVKELMTDKWEKIEEYIRESDSKSTNIGFNVNIDMKNKSTKVNIPICRLKAAPKLELIFRRSRVSGM